MIQNKILTNTIQSDPPVSNNCMHIHTFSCDLEIPRKLHQLHFFFSVTEESILCILSLHYLCKKYIDAKKRSTNLITLFRAMIHITYKKFTHLVDKHLHKKL